MRFRRKFTNNTGAGVTRLRFRIMDITTLGSTENLTPPVADLRAITSGDVTVVAMIGGVHTPIQVNGTTLEQPPAQPNGGGINSTLAAGTITPASPLGIGEEINVQFLLGIKAGGKFRFFVYVEALP